jgi:hypothetical protein
VASKYPQLSPEGMRKKVGFRRALGELLVGGGVPGQVLVTFVKQMKNLL